MTRSEEIARNPFDQFPMLRWAASVCKRGLGQPLAGIHVAFVLHFLTDLLPFACACKELGLAVDRAVFFFKSEYKYPYREAIRRWLEGQNFQVRAVGEVDRYIGEMESTLKAQGGTC